MDIHAERAPHHEALAAAAPEHLARLSWNRTQVLSHQRDALRELLRHAQACSPFHARRLAGVEPDAFDLDHLQRLATMTKTDLMANFDAAVTDRRLTRDLVERHVAATGDEPMYLLDEYTVLASGGSSGQRGVFVYDQPALVDYTLGLIRSGLRRLGALGEPPPGGVPMAMVAAGSGIHATRALSRIFSGGPLAITPVSVTQPLPAIVAQLNRAQPVVLQGYPSVLTLLANEKLAGRLTITPLAVTGSSEQFPSEARQRVTEAFGVPVVDQFGSSEGLVGASRPSDEAIILASDLCIVELVDEHDQPVPVGTPSAKVLVTNLFNRVQPLIRYELTDRFVQHPNDPGHGHLKVTVEGRQDDLLRYDHTVVHPVVVRSILVTTPDVIEYQVRQTATGIDVTVVTNRPLDQAALASRLTDALASAGLKAPDVRVGTLDGLQRDPLTGKAKRFVTRPTPTHRNEPAAADPQPSKAANRRLNP